MDLLKRKLAPILPDAWKLIDQEAARVLRLHLAGRKIVDFQGPFGWKFAAVNTGRLTILPDPAPEVGLGIREVQPLVEARIPIKLSSMELDTVARGAEDPDLDPVVAAAEKIALLEDTAIFNGLPSGKIRGILETSSHTALPLPADIHELPLAILEAKDILRRNGVNGPYALILGTDLYDKVFGLVDDGYPLSKRIGTQIVDKIFRASAVDGAAVISLRGGDYELTVGQDLSIGYAFHSRDEIELYITESFTFRVLEPSASVRLVRVTAA